MPYDGISKGGPYQMGLGHEDFDHDAMGWASEYRSSESTQLQCFKYWQRLRTAEPTLT